MTATAHDLIAFIRQLVHEAVQAQANLPVEGLVQPGSWDPVNGTVYVMIGTSGTLSLDSPKDYTGSAPGPDQQTLYTNPVQIMTEHTGAKGGPIGMERVILFPYEGGMMAKLLNSSDNTPPVPAGEHHVYLRSFDMNQVIACFVKVGNNSTDIGHAQQVNVLSPIVSLGTNQTQNGNQLVRQQDLQQAIQDVTNNVQDALNALAAIVQAGYGVTGPTVDVATANSSEISYTA